MPGRVLTWNVCVSGLSPLGNGSCHMFGVASLKEVKGVSAVSFVAMWAERLELALREEFCPLQVFWLLTR